VILANAIYRGEMVWNRSEWIKDHETGKRRRYERPESEWTRQTSSAWEIVSPELWERVRGIAAQKRSAYDRGKGGRLLASRGQHGPSLSLLAGFLRARSVAGASTRCAARKCTVARGTATAAPTFCSSRLRIRREALEDRILGTIRDRVLILEHLALAVQHALKRVADGLRLENPAASRARLAEIERELANLVRFAAKTGKTEEATELYAELDAERARIRERLASAAPMIDPERLCRVGEKRVIEIRGALGWSPEHRRRVLRELLGGRRLAIGSDPDRGFRVVA
jgi:site-specific DNA recombinase